MNNANKEHDGIKFSNILTNQKFSYLDKSFKTEKYMNNANKEDDRTKHFLLLPAHTFPTKKNWQKQKISWTTQT